MTDPNAEFSGVLRREAATFSLERVGSAPGGFGDGPVPVSLSSETISPRAWFMEQLDHSPEAVDLSVASERGISLLFEHDKHTVGGRLRNLRLDVGTRRLLADAYFAPTDKGRELEALVRGGFLVDTSLGYKVSVWEPADLSLVPPGGLAIARRWRPVEGSFVSVPADATVGVTRSETVESMMDAQRLNEGNGGAAAGTAETAAAAPASAAGGAAGTAAAAAGAGAGIGTRAAAPAAPAGFVAAPVYADNQAAERRGFEQGRADYQREVQDINARFAPFLHVSGMRDLRDEVITRGATVEQAQHEINAMLAAAAGVTLRRSSEAGAAPRAGAGLATDLQAGGLAYSNGEDSSEKLARSMEQALLFRAGGLTNEEASQERGANPYLGHTVLELGRELLARHDRRAPADRNRLVEVLLDRSTITNTTSDFPAIFSNVGNRFVTLGFNQAEESWRRWARVVPMTTFHEVSGVTLSQFSKMLKVAQDGQIQPGYFSDNAEKIKLETYARSFTFNRQMMIDDQLGAFSGALQKMGQSWAATIGDVAVAALTDNPVMSDGDPLFDASHGNLESAAAPSVGSVTSAAVAMALQRGPDPKPGEEARRTGNRARFLMHPVSLRGIVQSLAADQRDPDNTDRRNTVSGTFEPVEEHRLDPASPASAKPWYMSADPNLVDTVYVGLLDGREAPNSREYTEPGVLGVGWEVYGDVAAAPMDFRGLVRNPGVV